MALGGSAHFALFWGFLVGIYGDVVLLFLGCYTVYLRGKTILLNMAPRPCIFVGKQKLFLMKYLVGSSFLHIMCKIFITIISIYVRWNWN